MSMTSTVRVANTAALDFRTVDGEQWPHICHPMLKIRVFEEHVNGRYRTRQRPGLAHR
jgi:hypothetical protein